VDNPQHLTVLSLCSGYGGLELGLSRALENPLRVIAVEVEAYALANLVAKAEEGKLAIEALYPDLKTFPAERFSGCFDIITAGYPCQPFSVAGKQLGEKDPRHLWPHIARIIKAVRPVYGFFENVPGHLTLGFPEVYCSLRDMGYSVEAGLFTASEVGAPHKRQRLFILASSSDGAVGNAAILKPTQEQASEGSLQEWAELSRASELANTSGTEHERWQGQPSNNAEELQALAGSCHKWPARPGQPQHKWEEPRVIVDNPMQRRHQPAEREVCARGDGTEYAGELENPSRLLRAGLGWQVRRRRGVCGTSAELADPRGQGSERLPQPEGRDCDREIRDSGGQGQTESSLGSSVNGPSTRVDQLRLLGNGVVWQQAELALRRLKI